MLGRGGSARRTTSPAALHRRRGARSAAAAALLVVGACGSPPGPGTPAQDGRAPGGPAPITSVTRIAGAGVLGNDRRPDESCAPSPSPPDAGPGPAPVRHEAGETGVVADPQRIAVLSDDALDFLCALGLQDRVVGAARAPGADAPPSYLGAVVHMLPSLGTQTAPDVAAVAAARPDLVLGSAATAPQSYAALSQLAPTVFTGASGARWQDNLRTVGAATGRVGAVEALLAEFASDARALGETADAVHHQASVVRLTEDTVRIDGADDFAGSVLTQVGVDRPASQRFTDTPYLDIGSSDLADADFRAADGDAVFVSFAGPAARERAPEVLGSASWRALSAARDSRVYAVNDEVWQSGRGIVAARGILADLRLLNAPIN